MVTSREDMSDYDNGDDLSDYTASDSEFSESILSSDTSDDVDQGGDDVQFVQWY